MQTVLLTGATGSVGFQTLKELLKYKDKYKLKAFEINTRKTRKKLIPYKNKIEIIWGDITNYVDIEKAVENSDIIIHTAALIPPKADEFTKLAENVNVNGTQNIVNAINKFNSDIFLIYTSSISVYGDRIKNHEIKVSDKLNPSPKDYYAVTKIQAENYIKIHISNFTIFRLSAVMHPKIKLNPLFFHMPLNTSLEIVTTKDVAFALVSAIQKKDYLNEQIFNLGGGEKCRIAYNDFLNENFKIFGLGKLNFPKYAFGEKNFHCGYYADTEILNDILNFQRDNLSDYLNEVRNSVNTFKKGLSAIFKNLIKKKLLQKSEPFHAFKNKDIEMVNHFFMDKVIN